MRKLGLVVAALVCVATSARAADDAAIHARVETLREAAAKIVIDGNIEDWASFYFATDPSGDAGADASRDLVRAAIAPTDDALLVALTVTSVYPVVTALNYWINIDFFGQEGADLQIGFDGGDGTDTAWIFPPGKDTVAGSVEGIELALARAIEVRIPYSGLPEAIRSKVVGPRARPWVRVTPFTWNRDTERYVDFGPTVASYRLSAGAYDLDGPLPGPGSAKRGIGLPLDGKWYVGQGAFGAGTHKGLWAYDFYPVDEAHGPLPRNADKSDNSAYYGWNAPVTLRDPGRVIGARSNASDNTPRVDNAGKTPNSVELDMGGGLELLLLHFHQDSVAVRKGQPVEPGTVVGNVGNSGLSWWPHLHMAFYKLPGGQTSLPAALSNVRVSLNYGEDDPWARDLDFWSIHEGLFVENRP